MGVSVSFSKRLCLLIAFVVLNVSAQFYGGRLVPNDLVKTSDGVKTSLCTGLLYALYHKELQGPVTYLKSDHVTSHEADTKDNILVVRNLHHRNGLQYLPTGRFRKSTYFAVQKHSDFYYKLINIDFGSPVTYIPARFVVANSDGIQDDTLVVKDVDHPQRDFYQPGGEWEESTLFAFLKHGDSYKLFHKELGAAVTYNPAAYAPRNLDGSSDDTLVVRGGFNSFANAYKPGGEWEASTMFDFIPVRYQMVARISNFEYDGLAYNLNEWAKGKSGLSESLLNHTNESFDEIESFELSKVSKKIVNTVAVTFFDSDERRFLQHGDVNVKISASFGFIGGEAQNIEDNWDKKSTPLSASRVLETDVTDIRPPTTPIELLPQDSVEVTAFWTPVDVTIPFKAAVKVTAMADRLKSDGSVNEMVAVDVEAVKSLLQYRGFKGSFVTDGDHVTFKMLGTVRVQRAVQEFTVSETFSLDDLLD